MQIGENNPPKQGSSTKGGVDLPKGWWAQRMDTTNSSGIKSFNQGDSVIPFPPSQSEFFCFVWFSRIFISYVTIAQLIKSFNQGDSVIPFPPSQSEFFCFVWFSRIFISYVTIAQLIRLWDCVCTVEKGNLADFDGSKDSSLESTEFPSYGRNNGTFFKEVKRNKNMFWPTT
jgi:hypothetical protein